jgi:hypothetical protein
MEDLVRSHGGRYLNLDKNNKLNIDTDLNLDRSSDDLESRGSIFKLSDLQKLANGEIPRCELLSEQGHQTNIEDQGKKYKVYIEKYGDEHQVRDS